MSVDSALLEVLACPHDGAHLTAEGATVRCPQGHAFPVIQDTPVLLRTDVMQTIGLAADSLREAKAHAGASGKEADPWHIATVGVSADEKASIRRMAEQGGHAIDPVAMHLVGATNGILYRHLIGNLREYPIPEIGLPPAHGERLLDVGCSWGRWSIAAARKGYRPIGIDPSLGAVLTARRIANSMNVPFVGVVGDARYLPFRAGTFDAAYSYSVLQHFSKQDARTALMEIARVLKAQGTVQIQMAAAFGIRSLQHQLKRRFREPIDFEVRYWSPRELKSVFGAVFGEATLEPDCFFGLGLQPSDMKFMTTGRRALIHTSEVLKRLSAVIPPLTHAADSITVRSTLRDANARGADLSAYNPS